MANEEHVKIVKQGADAIQKWREVKTGVQLDLFKADLRVADLISANLTDAKPSELGLTQDNCGRFRRPD